MKRYLILPEKGLSAESNRSTAAAFKARCLCLERRCLVDVRDTKQDVYTHRYVPEEQQGRVLLYHFTAKGEPFLVRSQKTSFGVSSSTTPALSVPPPVPPAAVGVRTAGTPRYNRVYKLVPDGPPGWEEREVIGSGSAPQRARDLCKELMVDVRILDTESKLFTHRYQWSTTGIELFKYDLNGKESPFTRETTSDLLSDDPVPVSLSVVVEEPVAAKDEPKATPPAPKKTLTPTWKRGYQMHAGNRVVGVRGIGHVLSRARRKCSDARIDVKVYDTEEGCFTHRYHWTADNGTELYQIDRDGAENLHKRYGKKTRLKHQASRPAEAVPVMQERGEAGVTLSEGEKPCKQCRKPFLPKRSNMLYCAPVCYVVAQAARKTHDALPQEPKTCPQCKKAITAKFNHTRYCGKDCRREAERNVRKAKRAMRGSHLNAPEAVVAVKKIARASPAPIGDGQCLQCKTPFEKVQAGKMYCSDKCRYQAYRKRYKTIDLAAQSESEPSDLLTLIDNLQPKQQIRDFLASQVGGWLLGNDETPESFMEAVRAKVEVIKKQTGLMDFIAKVKAARER